MTRVLPKVLLCLFMFEAVHRRSNSLKTFHLQFRLGSFQTHDDEVQVGNSGRIAVQDFLKDGWNAIRFGSPARLNLPLRKEAALNHMPSRPEHDFRTTMPLVSGN